ncbi:acetyl-CoA C-acyltransferase [Dasania marina]|uniref:acetyl-CoA C-acyltransferase n=1 Tax=Dasania marina TaxID=471499 RepID=UPI0030DC36A2
MSLESAYIYDGLRTPFGRHGGVLAPLRADNLLGFTIRKLIERHPQVAPFIEEVIAGATNQAGEDCRNVARMAGLLSGLPVTVGGQTVNRLCGSSLAAVLDVSRALRCGEGDFYVACGVESMSRAPFVMAKAEKAFSRDVSVFDTTIGTRFPNPDLIAAFGDHSMPETAENVARELAIGREACDRFAADSQAKYQRAFEAGYFEGEIIGVEVGRGRNNPAILVDKDEHPRSESTFEKLSSLKPMFASGVVTAGNASGINDGASALLLGGLSAGEKCELLPRGRILTGAISGIEPRIMGLGPVAASRKALARAGLSLADMDVIELNEAFAAQALGCLQQMGVASNDSRVNPNGGAIAMGHPLGASGARIMLTALRQLELSGGRYGLATMCIGMGQGIALVIERV